MKYTKEICFSQFSCFVFQALYFLMLNLGGGGEVHSKHKNYDTNVILGFTLSMPFTVQFLL